MDFVNFGIKKNILIGITSSIAAYKIYELIRFFKKSGFEVKTILTPNAKNFVSPLVLETLTNSKVYFEQFSPREDVEHIELAKWADVFLIAPISANTISKFATGVSDNLLTSIFCAYLGTKKPFVLAPAMNMNMWQNPFVKENLSKLKKEGAMVVEPESGFLACGDNGIGKLADIENIFHYTLRSLFQKKENNSKKMVVTYGGTKEKIDSVRCLTNSSSGKMGRALSLWGFYLGFEVASVSTFQDKLPFLNIVSNSALEMLEALKNLEFDCLIMAAAVGDFRIKQENEFKISKENVGEILNLEFIKNPDVVFEIAKNKKENQKIVGFCLADRDLIETAKKKLKNKNLDYIVANDVKTALNTSENRVTIIEKSGKIKDIEQDKKEIIAKKILEVVCD